MVGDCGDRAGSQMRRAKERPGLKARAGPTSCQRTGQHGAWSQMSEASQELISHRSVSQQAGGGVSSQPGSSAEGRTE